MICFLFLMYLYGDIFVNKELENFLKERKDTEALASILDKAKVEEEQGNSSTVSESARKSNLTSTDDNKSLAQNNLSNMGEDKSSANLVSENTTPSESAASSNLSSSDNKESAQISAVTETTGTSNLAPGGDKKQGDAKGGASKGGSPQKDKKDGKSDGKDPDVKNIKVGGKDAVLVKSEGDKDKPSVVVVADQSAMKNKEDLKKLASQAGGSGDKTGSKDGDKPESKNSAGGDSKAAGAAPKSSLINLSSDITTQEGKSFSNSQLSPTDKKTKDGKVSTVLIGNKPKAVVINVKTLTVIESMTDVQAPATKDENIKSTSSINKGKEDKSKDKKKDEKSIGNKNSDKKKTENKKQDTGGKSPIKYETNSDKNNKKEDKESSWTNIFTMSSPEGDKNKRLKNSQPDKQQTPAQVDKKATNNKVEDKSKDKNTTGKLEKAKKTDITKDMKKSVQKQEIPDAKKVVESVVFIGKDKALKTISKKDLNKKNKETSMDDLLYVLKNMPGKVNINKEGKEVYIEGDFFTPKEKNAARKEFKFSGVLKAKDTAVKQK